MKKKNKSVNKSTNKKMNFNDDDFEYYGDYYFSENELSDTDSDNKSDNDVVSNDIFLNKEDNEIISDTSYQKNNDLLNSSSSPISILNNINKYKSEFPTLGSPNTVDLLIKADKYKLSNSFNDSDNEYNLTDNNNNNDNLNVTTNSDNTDNSDNSDNTDNTDNTTNNNINYANNTDNIDNIDNTDNTDNTNTNNSINKEKMINKLDNIICGNCNKTGHYYKHCPLPLSSYGLICYKKINNEYKIILVRRKDTIGYIEFLRGKYDLNDISYIKKLFNLMTNNEKQRILHIRDFDKLRDLLGLTRKSNIYKIEYDSAKDKFNKLLNILDDIVNESDNQWIEPEWGIPKGRRHFKETDVDCSIREFSEETLINPNEISILTNVKPLEEIYVSFNGVTYRHVYYFSEYLGDKEIRIDPSNNQQAIEISAIKWANYNEGLNLIRSYHQEKRNIFKKALQILYNKDKYFEEVNLNNY